MKLLFKILALCVPLALFATGAQAVGHEEATSEAIRRLDAFNSIISKFEAVAKKPAGAQYRTALNNAKAALQRYKTTMAVEELDKGLQAIDQIGASIKNSPLVNVGGIKNTYPLLDALKAKIAAIQAKGPEGLVEEEITYGPLTYEDAVKYGGYQEEEPRVVIEELEEEEPSTVTTYPALEYYPQEEEKSRVFIEELD